MKTNDEIFDLLVKLESQVRIQTQIMSNLSKQKKSNKMNQLANAVRRAKRMTAQDVQTLFDMSRPWAIELMKRLDGRSGFSFRLGNSRHTKQSVIIYREEIAKEKLFNFIALLAKKDNCSLAEIMNEGQIDFIEANFIAELFVKERKGFTFIPPRIYLASKCLRED